MDENECKMCRVKSEAMKTKLNFYINFIFYLYINMTTTTNKINGRVKGEIETFTIGTYNGISVLVRDKDGYINATKLAARYSENKRKNLERFLKSEDMSKIIQYWTENECKLRRLGSEATNETRPYYQILEASNEFKGMFVHPDLIHFVAQWVDISYAFAVKHVMDSINDKVHEVLEKNELPDTPENAKPAFVEVVKQIAPSSIDIGLINKQCWGYRERFHELDQWEQDDLRRDVNEYEEKFQRKLEKRYQIH